MALVLHQVIAVEKGAKARLMSTITEIYQANQKPDDFNGFVKKYTPIDEEGEKFHDENKQKLVKNNYIASIKKAKKAFSELFDSTAMRDFANCNAKADVIVDGQVLIRQAPCTYLLFLEKKLVDIQTMVTAIPTLNPEFEWSKDPNSNLFRSEPITTVKTKKVAKVITLAPATDKHPAQAQVAQEDVTAGHWSTTNLSGAMPVTEKEEILERLEKIIKEVKCAREKANTVVAEDIKVGDAILAYIFK